MHIMLSVNFTRQFILQFSRISTHGVTVYSSTRYHPFLVVSSSVCVSCGLFVLRPIRSRPVVCPALALLPFAAALSPFGGGDDSRGLEMGRESLLSIPLAVAGQEGRAGSIRVEESRHPQVGSSLELDFVSNFAEVRRLQSYTRQTLQGSPSWHLSVRFRISMAFHTIRHREELAYVIIGTFTAEAEVRACLVGGSSDLVVAPFRTECISA